jgi:transcriptional regulator GlxA family with amidase domain
MTRVLSAGDSRPLRIVLLCVPPVRELDVVGPLEVFTAANECATELRKPYRIEVATVGAPGEIIRGECRLGIVPDSHYARIKGNVDTLLIPGGSGPMRPVAPGVTRWLQSMAGRVRRLGSICTGSYLLAEAGLLHGKRAATHWKYAAQMAKRYPDVTVDPGPIFIKDGHTYTSAGVTAGMDLALAMVEEDFGSTLALAVAKDLVLFLRRPGGQAQFSVPLSAQNAEASRFSELQTWLLEHIARPLSVERMASQVAMSPRNFARLFVQETGATPARFLERLRVEEARRRLELSHESLTAVARKSGFGSAELMRRAFLRCIQTTPKQYRSQFHPEKQLHQTSAAV